MDERDEIGTGEAEETAEAAPEAGPTRIRCADTTSEAYLDLCETLLGYDAGTIEIEKVELEGRTGQDFYLERQGDAAVIRYTTPESLNNAVYTLLGSLGFRWYGPGENWTVRPEAIPPSDIAGEWRAPTFRNTFFFGTGGLELAAPEGVDPEGRYKRDWLRWKRRLRICADFEPASHSGEAFYMENRELLEAHPEWFNSDTGMRCGRFRVEVPEALEAYKDWVQAKYRDHIGARFVNVNTEPEDGRGGEDDPLPPPETGLQNHADKWWHVTNEVAKLYDEDDPMTVVVAYAYGDGATAALAPGFELRRNVYPTLIPYAFQSAYLPSEMIREWSQRVPAVGVYDYWNITQWSKGLPQLDLYSLKPKLELWAKHKVTGVYIETTDGAGPMGHAWWIASQLLFDLTQDFEGLYAQYLGDCFGPAAPVMRRMYDRWSKTDQGPGETALMLRDLQEATDLVTYDGPEWRRLNELKAYSHYMRLFHQHDDTAASREALFHYLYGIHHLMMVQTAAFQGQAYLAPFDAPIPAGLGQVLGVQEIEDNFAADLAAMPVAYEAFAFDFNPANASFVQPAENRAWRYGGNVNTRFFARETGDLVFDAGATETAVLTIYDDDRILLEESLGVNDHTFTETIDDQIWHMKSFALPVEAGRTYSLDFVGYFSRLTMHGEVVLLQKVAGEDFDTVGYPAIFFYVPLEVTEIVFHDEVGTACDPGGSVLVAPDGTECAGEATAVPKRFRVAVPPEHRGMVWQARFTHQLCAIKNFPAYGALAPFGYSEQG